MNKFTLNSRLSSTETEIVERCISAVRATTARRGWWATAAGRAAQNYLEGWGATVRERKLSGDSTALPKMASWRGSWQGTVDGMPALAMVTESVTGWIVGRTVAEQRLLTWIYVMAMEDRPIIVQYEFSDGSFSDPQPATDPEPIVGWERVVSLCDAWAPTNPLSQLPAAAFSIDGAVAEFGCLGAEYWKAERTRFLEAMHLGLAKDLARDLGLK